MTYGKKWVDKQVETYWVRWKVSRYAGPFFVGAAFQTGVMALTSVGVWALVRTFAIAMRAPVFAAFSLLLIACYAPSKCKPTTVLSWIRCSGNAAAKVPKSLANSSSRCLVALALLQTSILQFRILENYINTSFSFQNNLLEADILMIIAVNYICLALIVHCCIMKWLAKPVLQLELDSLLFNGIPYQNCLLECHS